jgi:hypothetical protein
VDVASEKGAEKRVNYYNEWRTLCTNEKRNYIPLLLIVVEGAVPVLARSCVTTTCSTVGCVDSVEKCMFSVGTASVLQLLAH